MEHVHEKELMENAVKTTQLEQRLQQVTSEATHAEHRRAQAEAEFELKLRQIQAELHD